MQPDRSELLFGPMGRGFRPWCLPQFHGNGLGTKAFLPLPPAGKRQEKNHLHNIISAASRMTDMEPVGRFIASPGKVAWINKGLRQKGTDAIPLFPVAGQPSYGQPQGVRGKVFNLDTRRNQETTVVDHKTEISPPGFFAPANKSVPVGEHPGSGTKGQRSKTSMGCVFDKVSNLGAAQRTASERMIPCHHGIPYFGILGITAGHRSNGDLPQLRKPTGKFRKSQVDILWCRLLKSKGLLTTGKFDNSLVVQFPQRFTSTHLLKFSTGRTPVEPAAHQARQCVPRNRRNLACRFPNLVKDGAGKMLSTNLHVPSMPCFTPGVKCGSRSALVGEGQGGGRSP